MPKEQVTGKHAGPATPYKLGSRSCYSCYRRKVRCDRAVPCGYCERHGLVCVAHPIKASVVTDTDGTVAKKTPNLQSISDRLARVEDLLARLVERTEGPDILDALTLPPTLGNNTSDACSRHKNPRLQRQHHGPSQSQADQPSESTWEILLNDGQEKGALSFAVSPSVGSTPQDGMKHSMHDRSAVWRPPQLPFPHTSTPTSSPRNTLPGCTSQSHAHNMSNVYTLYPSTQLALQLWSVYVKAVDPVVKILHIPTVQSTVVATILDPPSAAPSTLALTLAIYYAALTAEPTILAPEESRVQIERCKTALDSLLTIANLVDCPDMPFLQALSIYVTCLRVHEVGRSVWVLNGLAIRLAQSMGLHRDGIHLRPSPFETEMRLRLWWHLCVLDSRAPEDQGLQPNSAVTSCELRQPRNVNDAQLYPGMTQLPADVAGSWTDMSFFLVQTEGCRQMHPILETQAQQEAPEGVSAAAVTDPLHTIGEKHKLVRDPAHYMQARFGISVDEQKTLPDLARMAIQHVGTAVKKMEFVLQLRKEITLQRSAESSRADANNDDAREPALLRPSFRLACAALESSRALQQDSASMPFAWFFRTYTQWYALAYVLRCLCCRPRECTAETQALSEHAWELVDALLPNTSQLHEREFKTEDHDSIWSYLHKLRQQAAQVRDEQVRMIAAGAGQAEASLLVVQPPEQHAELSLVGQASATADANLFAEADSGEASQDMMSSLDLFMADIPFLPDWDAFIPV
ncbi:hypothetical protein SEPCBS57363_000112 [Sporothrix epigloea]|uniref:Zn(2)-C6 fungal-type domain-containing protein n=1 Tax=Sporothrix epigloea TaxID=1892477 RepID=A0ABP0D4E2_9PEZI